MKYRRLKNLSLMIIYLVLLGLAAWGGTGPVFTSAAFVGQETSADNQFTAGVLDLAAAKIADFAPGPAVATQAALPGAGQDCAGWTAEFKAGATSTYNGPLAGLADIGAFGLLPGQSRDLELALTVPDGGGACDVELQLAAVQTGQAGQASPLPGFGDQESLSFSLSGVAPLPALNRITPLYFETEETPGAGTGPAADITGEPEPAPVPEPEPQPDTAAVVDPAELLILEAEVVIVEL
jgi:hypothetical protein